MTKEAVMKRLCLVLLAGLLVFPGCGEDGKDCGEGTVEAGGECVPLILDCAPGTRQEGFECVPMCPSGEVWDGNQCVLAAECAPGTVLQGDQCVPACGTDQYWDGNACADVPECDTGTTFNPQTGRCEINETVCAPGTRLENGVCVPGGNPAADVYETGEPDQMAQFEVPAVGGSVSLGGVVDTPEDINGDGYDDPNWDGFEFTASAGTWLRITATSYGAALPAFYVVSMDENEDTYVRWAANPNGLEVVREVYLPRNDTYRVWVTDYTHLMGFLFRYGVIPVGGEDFTYYITIENLGTPTPTDVSTLPYTESGDFNDGALRFYSLTSLVSGDIVNLASAGIPVPGVETDVCAALMIFDSNGTFVAEDVVEENWSGQKIIIDTVDFLLAAQSSGDVLVVVDYDVIVGPNREFLFTATDMQSQDCIATDCSTGSIPANTTELLSWDLTIGQLLAFGVFLPVPATEDDYRVIKVAFLDENMNPILGEDMIIDFQAVAKARAYADRNMRVFLWIREAYGLDVPEYTIEEVVHDTPELQVGSDYTGLTVKEFPPWTYDPAGVDHIVGEAGKLIIMNAFTPHGTWDTPRERIFNKALDGSPDMDDDGEPDPIGPVIDGVNFFPYSVISPTFFYARTNDHYLHYVDEEWGTIAGNTYDVGVRVVDITDLGAPTVSQPVRLDYQNLSGWDFYSFTAHKNQWTEISVYQRTFSDIQAEVWVFNFGSVFWNWTHYLWLTDPDAERLCAVIIEEATAPGEDITVGYNSPYDGMTLILIQDATGQATIMDLFDIEVSIPPAPANDDCANAEAVTLSGGSASISGDSRSATDSVTEGVCDRYISDSGPEVFYSLTLNAGDTVEITLDGTDFNEALYLFTDCADVAGSTVAFANEDSPEVINYEVPAGAGGTHYIGVDACGQGGDFTLDIVVNGP
jgi:hypothetical protein